METTLEVNEASQVAEVRRVSASLGEAEGLTPAELGRLALVATEAATNLVKYAKAGTVTLSRFAHAGQHGVQLIAVDHGPGLADFAAASRDGHSTAGSLGIGLGVIMRSSSLFDVHSVLGQGTALVARVAHAPGRHAAPAPASAFETSGRSRPKLGQVECGDAWGTLDLGNQQLVCIVDGLGHGPLAALAAQRAIGVFASARVAETPADILLRAHADLKQTRGVVMAVLAIDRAAATATFSGIGNIEAAIYLGTETRHLLSVDGTVGYRVRAARNHTAPWEPGSVAILHTDGVSARWSPKKYPGLLARHPSLVASVLFRDHARNTDDATIVVAKGT
jgi:anti-sigma regulatory factor (Ser/Thr protein kinase)